MWNSGEDPGQDEKGGNDKQMCLRLTCVLWCSRGLKKEDKAAILEGGGHSVFLTILLGVMPMHLISLLATSFVFFPPKGSSSEKINLSSLNFFVCFDVLFKF